MQICHGLARAHTYYAQFQLLSINLFLLPKMSSQKGLKDYNNLKYTKKDTYAQKKNRRTARNNSFVSRVSYQKCKLKPRFHLIVWAYNHQIVTCYVTMLMKCCKEENGGNSFNQVSFSFCSKYILQNILEVVDKTSRKNCCQLFPNVYP